MNIQVRLCVRLSNDEQVDGEDDDEDVDAINDVRVDDDVQSSS